MAGSTIQQELHIEHWSEEQYKFSKHQQTTLLSLHKLDCYTAKHCCFVFSFPSFLVLSPWFCKQPWFWFRKIDYWLDCCSAQSLCILRLCYFLLENPPFGMGGVWWRRSNQQKTLLIGLISSLLSIIKVNKCPQEGPLIINQEVQWCMIKFYFKARWV